jgi:putative transposase
MPSSYPSDLSLDEFELVKSFLPEAKSGGRPRTTDLWAILNAIFYLVAEGCRWRAMPHDFPAWQTVYTYFRAWKKDGTWLTIHDALHDRCRVIEGHEISPSETMLDSQSVKSATRVHEAVGFDAAKLIKGRKRHLTVDCFGLVLRVFVSAASLPERAGGKVVLQRIQQMKPERIERMYRVWADSGYSGDPFLMWVMDILHWVLQVVVRPQEQRQFVLLPKRWVVERTFGWLMNHRRLVRDYELLPVSSETMIYLAMIRNMLRRLA